MRTIKALILLYLIGISCLTAVLLIRPHWAQRIHAKLAGIPPSELSEFHHRMRGLQAVSASLVPNGSIFLIGDSISQSVEPRLIGDTVINYGISGDTTLGVLDRLGDLHFERASLVILAIGTNDIHYRSPQQIITNIEQIIAGIPLDVPIILSSVLYVDESRTGHLGSNVLIQQINDQMKVIAVSSPRLHFLENDRLKLNNSGNPAFLQADGLHLNPAGVTAWSQELREAIAEATASN